MTDLSHPRPPVVGLECGICKDHIWSSHRWDWQDCSCGGLFVDGGRDYLRCGGTAYQESCRVLVDPNTDKVLRALEPGEDVSEEINPTAIDPA